MKTRAWLNFFFQTKRQDNLHFISYWKASKQQLTTTDIFLVYTFFTLPVVQWVTEWGWCDDITSHYSNVRFTAPIIRFDINWWWSSWVNLTYFPQTVNVRAAFLFLWLVIEIKCGKRKKRTEKQSWMIEFCVLAGCLGEKSYASLFYFRISLFFHD